LRHCTIDSTKITTDRHEASCGLFATAELLVRQGVPEKTAQSLVHRKFASVSDRVA